MLYQKFFVSSRRFFKFSPDSARDGSFGGFYVKVQIIYDADKQLVKKILNIPRLRNRNTFDFNVVGTS